MEELKLKAKKLSEDFIENEKEYMLGFVEAEQSNPLTKTLGEDYLEDTKKGIETLIKADEALIDIFRKVIESKDFDIFTDKVYNSIINGGRIFVSGCGSPGRLAMRVEASWRKRMKNTQYENSVVSIMTGGDYALIRAVESFEDYIALGRNQAKELLINEKDLLIGVTATGETTSILGTAVQALDDNASVYMVICTRPDTILGKLKRADDVYTHKNCSSLYIPCGGMAVTGSTRMQSTSIEQAVVSSALELSLLRILSKKEDKELLINGFASAVSAVKKSTDSLKENTDKEFELYNNGGHVTYFADEFLLDVLADTTERGPTFSTPPFRPQKRKDLTLSWAFVKNPFLNTVDAWEKCFERTPRCIDKSEEDYLNLGLKAEDVKKIPDISLNALYGFEIGNEPDPEREQGESFAMWVADGDMPEEFIKISGKYKNSGFLKLESDDIIKTELDIFEHLSMKMLVNILSTGVMAKMGKIYGNYMVNLNITNKKLVDRATRIISDLCGVDYKKANYELFLSKLLIEKDGLNLSQTKMTIDRLKGEKL